MKFAIRIVSGKTGKSRLFAVAKDDRYVTALRNLAKQEIRDQDFSSDSISTIYWGK